MADFDTPIPMEEEPEADDPMSALMALSRQQQQRREEALARLRATAQQQGSQAQGLRNVALLTSFGQNPLLQGLQREAGSQGAQLQGMAAQAEARADGTGRGGGLDPLGIARLQQMAEYQRKQQELTAQRLAQQAEADKKKLEQREAEAAAKAEAARIKAAAGAEAKAAKDAERLAAAERKIIGDTRKEFEGLKVVKDYRDAEVAFDKVKAAFASPSAANDMAGIYAVMKVYDPGSVVKETEFANAENAKGVPDWLRSKWNKVLEGERLTAEQRADFLRSADGQFGAHRKAYETQVDRYSRLAPEGKAEQVVGFNVAPRAPSTVQRTPAHTAMPKGPGGSLLLDSPQVGQTQPSGDLVKVINPEGKPGRIPRSNLEKAKAKGYKEVP